MRQMVVFHSLVLLYKAKHDKKPVYLYSKISQAFCVNTRLGISDEIKETIRFTSTLGQQSFIPRTIKQWNSMPGDLRSASSLPIFNAKAKMWTKENF